ncbi:MAG: TonB-dependent receptor [Ignavibacteria bacterium]|jgi:outer membrane receptor protein involved in Fe transport
MNYFSSRLSLVVFLSLIILFNISTVYSQNKIEVQGIVVDSTSSKPIAFANISIAGSMEGTTTDSNGKFVMQIEEIFNAKLVISHINYIKKEIILTDSLTNHGITVLMHPKVRRLEDVVVTATLSEKPFRKITKSADIISNKQIAESFQSNMVDVLNNTPGFSQVWEYHSPLLLRGMNSNRLIVMKNGNRRIGTFPGGYFAQDINIYEAKKIEIIKGPGSVIYGSGAISGIVNIISPEPFGKKSTSAKVISGYGGNNNEFLEAANFCYKKEKFGLNLHAKYRVTDDYIYGNGETANNSDVEDRDLSFNAGYKFSDKHNVIFHVDYHYGDWGKPRGFNGPTKAFTKIKNVEDGIHTAFNYSFIPNSSVKSVHLNLFYDDGSRDYYKYKYSTVTDKLSTLDLVHYKDNYGGGRLYTIIEPVDSYIITTGIDGYIFMLDNPSENIDYYNNTSGKDDGFIDAGQSSLGVFLNNEWSISDKLMLTLGVRYDYAKVDEGENSSNIEREEDRHAFSGNAGTVYSFNENTHLSFNIGRAFRMPIAEELFTTVVSCKGTKQGNPDLNPEYSWNFDLGFRGSAANEKFIYDFSAFYDLLDDYIGETAAVDNEDIDYTYKNVDARITGAEISASYRFNSIFKSSNTLYTGIAASYQYGIDLSNDDEHTPLFGIPPFKLTTNLNYHGLLNSYWITGYFLKLDAEFAAEQNRVGEIPEGTDGGPWGYEPSESHLIFNASLGVNINSLPGYPKLRIVIKNLLDADYKPFGSYIPAMGRNIKLMLSLNY